MKAKSKAETEAIWNIIADANETILKQKKSKKTESKPKKKTSKKA